MVSYQVRKLMHNKEYLMKNLALIFSTLITFSAFAGTNELQFTCINTQNNKIAEVAYHIGFDNDVTLSLSVYGDGADTSSVLDFDYIHQYEQFMKSDISSSKKIDMSELQMTSKGSLVSNRVKKVEIIRDSADSKVGAKLNIFYANGTSETLDKCTKDTPPIF
jgi:hypothetical protein